MQMNLSWIQSMNTEHKILQEATYPMRERKREKDRLKIFQPTSECVSYMDIVNVNVYIIHKRYMSFNSKYFWL